jgi:hypothetical protein
MKFPITRYIVQSPYRNVVRVKIEKTVGKKYNYPYVVKDDAGNVLFCIPDLFILPNFKSRRSAEKVALETLHQEYVDARRALRKAQNFYKWKLRQVEDYKNFGKLQNPYFD